MTAIETAAAVHAEKYAAAALSTQQKKNALTLMAKALTDNYKDIIAANEKDIENAKGKIPDAMIDRLFIDEKRLSAMAKGMTDVAALPDPIGNIIEKRTLASGLTLIKKSVPIGVIAIIYESRPNVTSDAAALCVMSGNCAVLRGGKEAINTNIAIVKALKKGLKEANVPENIIGLVEDTDRKSSYELMEAVGIIDLLIPRGSRGLIDACVKNSKVPCIQTGAGVCHCYVDESADLDMALDIIENAKCSRPSVCNALETVLINENIALKFLPMLEKKLIEDRKNAKKTPVELRFPESEDGFDSEYLDYILSVKTVGSVGEAIAHIRKHSTGHSETIITKNAENAEKFTSGIDSAAVYVNASTRFTDGGEFGLGCEIGISTQKLHARGPMGLRELTSYKYILLGDGQTR